MGLLAGSIVLFIFSFLLKEAWPAFRGIGLRHFIQDHAWHPTGSQFNLVPMILGTFLVSVSATLLAAPCGLLSGIFCRFYAPRSVVVVYRRILELLAGIPSVVFGLWGLLNLVPLINQIHPPGTSLLAGAIVLAIMILPTIAVFTDRALGDIPSSWITAAHAMGFSKSTTITKVALPGARSGIIGGILLAWGRALGETMAILMVAGNVPAIPHSIFAPVRTLTSNIALEMAYAMNAHRQSLYVSGLFLMLVISFLVLLSHYIVRRFAHE